MNELTPEEWRYISIVIAADIRTDKERSPIWQARAAVHMPIWEKIQPYCRWNDDETGVS